MAKKPAPKTTQKTPKAKPARGLGRGLSALMSDVNIDITADPKTHKESATVKPAAKDKDVASIAIDQLVRNPDQPRRYFDPEKLKELTESIRDKGVLQPILVRPVPRKINHAKKLYQIVAGERRWQAALKAGLDAMPVLIRDLTDQAVLEIGVVENVQRADLNPIEEALAYRALVNDFDRTQQEIAQAIGKSRPHIANMLRLLSLPRRAQEFLQEGKISTGHARAIIAAPDPVALAEDIAAKGLSVREAEDWVRRLKKTGHTPASVKPVKDADTRKVEADLTQLLGLKIDLRHKSPGGELRIIYKTSEQLDDILRRLKD